MNIILIDDDISALNAFIPSLVDNAEINCKMFMNNPLDALDYARQCPIDAAFLDIVMPQINGCLLAEKLIEICPTIKIAFISAFIENKEEVIKRIPKQNLAGFCSKPFSKKDFLFILEKVAKNPKPSEVRIRTFGAFDIFVDGKAIHFASSKAKELLALLVCSNGSYLYMGTAATYLWEEKTADLGKRLYRDAVYRLRNTLKDEGLEDLVVFKRGCAVINKSIIKCDLWDFYDAKAELSSDFMPQYYEWSKEIQDQLEKIQADRDKKNGKPKEPDPKSDNKTEKKSRKSDKEDS